jgi:Protein of unknown function (DUF992)
MSIKLSIRIAFAAALLGLGLTATTPARAGGVGMLTCQNLQPVGYVLWSGQTFNCVFRPAAGGPAQYYQADIMRLGAQVGVSNNVALAWAVFALGPQVAPGALAGGYGGASAGAAVGLGGRVNVLVGGFPNAFTLQPVSLEGEAGLNVVATVTGLRLTSVVHRQRSRRH